MSNTATIQQSIDYAPIFSGCNSPFILENEDAYRNWRKLKLEGFRRGKPAQSVAISDCSSLSAHELEGLSRQIRIFNFAIFELDRAQGRQGGDDLLNLGRQLGLHNVDSYPGVEANGLTALSAVDADDQRSRYVPYTSRALNWHTDGYYNEPDNLIGAFLLYCVNPAAEGGENFILDYEMLYLQIRDTQPDLLDALMDPQMMRIPANMKNNREIRSAQTGPVFIVSPNSGALQMRYSSRPRNIEWKSDGRSRRALSLVQSLIDEGKYAVSIKLGSGQGIVANNLLHGRSAFTDGEDMATTRLFYRARYYDAIDIPQYKIGAT